MKSTKQIADILGVSKMTVYRFIKSNNITETSQDGRTLLYDDTSVNLIVKGLSDKTDVTDATINDTSNFKEDYVIKLEEMNVFLKKEIEDKNNQIESLQTILNQQQQLLLYEQQKNTKLLEENKKWWQWWK